MNYQMAPCERHEFSEYDRLGGTARLALQQALFCWCAGCAREAARAENRPIKEVVAAWDAEELGEAS